MDALCSWPGIAGILLASVLLLYLLFRLAHSVWLFHSLSPFYTPFLIFEKPFGIFTPSFLFVSKVYTGSLQDLFYGLLEQTEETVLKQFPIKTVSLKRGLGQTYVVKTYPYPSWGRRLKYTFWRKSKGWQEAVSAHILMERLDRWKNVNSPLPQSLYPVRNRQKSPTPPEKGSRFEEGSKPLILPPFVILERLGWLGVCSSKVFYPRWEKAIPLSAYTDRFTPRSLPQDVLHRYALFTQALHDAGLYQDDFNPTNVLMLFPSTSEQDSNPYRLALVDFERLGLYPSLPFSHRVRNLAKLYRFAPSLPRTAYLRFLKTYLGLSSLRDSLSLLTVYQQAIEKTYGELRLKNYRQECKNALRTNRHYQTVHHNGRTMAFRKSWIPLETLENIVEAFDQQTERIRTIPLEKYPTLPSWMLLKKVLAHPQTPKILRHSLTYKFYDFPNDKKPKNDFLVLCLTSESHARTLWTHWNALIRLGDVSSAVSPPWGLAISFRSALVVLPTLP